MSADPAGMLLVDKPAGPTSHDVVQTVRKEPKLKGCRVGHAGTLDPFATGLLLVLVGDATKLQGRVMALTKTYVTTAQFGAHSDTGDSEGEIVLNQATTSKEAIANIIPEFVGEVMQQVPLYSAVKVNGERLYKKAHRGEQAQTPARVVSIKAIELLNFDIETQLAELKIICGKGTYIRQLIVDIGESLGTSAYCKALRRTRCGNFSVRQALSLDRFNQQTISKSPSWLPLTYRLGETQI